MIGKRLLVGVLFVDLDGSLDDHLQVVGSVRSAPGNLTLVLDREDGRGTFTIPYEPGLAQALTPGSYRLMPVDPLVENPDFLFIMRLQTTPGEDVSRLKLRGIECDPVPLGDGGPS